MSVSANTPAAPEAHEQTSRTPVLYLLGSGLCWLLVGLVLSALASLKLHAPEFLPFAWAGVGRLQAAASNVLLLGAASQAWTWNCPLVAHPLGKN
jgi:cbb3-type cytochrome oxidase subunit 1